MTLPVRKCSLDNVASHKERRELFWMMLPVTDGVCLKDVTSHRVCWVMLPVTECFG